MEYQNGQPLLGLVPAGVLDHQSQTNFQTSGYSTDDLMRLRTGSGPANMAVVKHFIVNLIKQIPDKASLKTRRKTLGWDDQYLHDALIQKWA